MTASTVPNQTPKNPAYPVYPCQFNQFPQFPQIRPSYPLPNPAAPLYNHPRQSARPRPATGPHPSREVMVMYLRILAVAFAFALILLLDAPARSAPAQARAIPWDCSDWQAFVHDDRTTAILESLAENRGKTLYCGIDQSDTFAKAETWEAGKDRNERDDTVYFGERGQFRGFIAAQEGWLTEGESGVTGVSRDRIFEFPREERRVKRVKRFTVGTDAEQFPITELASCDEVLGIVCTALGASSPSWNNGLSPSRRDGRIAQSPGLTTFHQINWETQAITNQSGTFVQTARPNTAGWLALVETKANQACRARGARYANGSAALRPGHSNNRGASQNDHGSNLGWFYVDTENTQTSGWYMTKARQSRTWTATCKKVIRRNRK